MELNLFQYIECKLERLYARKHAGNVLRVRKFKSLYSLAVTNILNCLTRRKYSLNHITLHVLLMPYESREDYIILHDAPIGTDGPIIQLT